MTIQEAKDKLIAWCRAQVGTCEGANNWNKYAAYLDPLEITYGHKQNLAWCAEFCLAGFVQCFGVGNALEMLCSPKPTAIPVCKDGAQYFKNAGRWYKTPEVGDVIFFYYSGDINHQGIVVEVGGGVVRTIEGNSSDMVANRAYAIGAANIAGYGRPKWSVLDGVEPSPTEDVPAAPAEPQPAPYSYCPYTYAVRVSLLKRGSYGPQVERVQQLLAALGFDPGAVDGVFGAATESALRAFQTAAGIDVDGEFGGQSFKALWNYKGASK